MRDGKGSGEDCVGDSILDGDVFSYMIKIYGTYDKILMFILSGGKCVYFICILLHF